MCVCVCAAIIGDDTVSLDEANYLADRRVALQVDYSFTVLNREHFTRNESFLEKNVCFAADNCSHGRATLIGATDLFSRNFLFDDSRFLVELEMRNPVTEFREEMQLPRDQRSLHHLKRYFASLLNCE